MRFTPLKKYFKYLSDQKGNFPLVGFLTNGKKAKLEEILGLSIKRKELFEQALIHRSYLQILDSDAIMSNERLEFLGDAVLGMIVAEYLFSLHSHVDEGDLTKMRSWLVNSNSLALCSKKLGLDKFIMLSYSAEKSLENGSDSIIADGLESIIGAIYLDSGLEIAKRFIINSLMPIEMDLALMKDTNFKSNLLEYVQAKGMEAPSYSVLEEEGPAHDKTFTVGVYIEDKLIALGKGKNKKQAEQLSAKKALQKKDEF